MPIINRIAAFSEDMVGWRRDLHQMPELGFECHETAQYVQDRLTEFGVDKIETGWAKTGLVAIIEGKGPGPTIGLRADMDGLPILETSGVDYASRKEGSMHACGHDGHMTMLLGAAKYLAETRNFSGRVALIFQPAEELGGGAGVMVEEGMLDHFDVKSVYALHNAPGAPLGTFFTNPGYVLAAVDTFEIHITGKGGHAALPHTTVDPVAASVGIAQALQTIVSRNHCATEDLVLSLTQIQTGSAENIVPSTAFLGGTVRTFNKEVQDMVEKRMTEIVVGQAASFGVEAELRYIREYPATVNTAAETEFACNVARELAGEQNVDDAAGRDMGAEDFAYMLEARPGSYVFIGNGASAGLHHPEYDFNDECAPWGASYFARLVEAAQPVKS
ncbi:MAG: M20 aminoacylase family protein [Pseudomonadota bacterium]